MEYLRLKQELGQMVRERLDYGRDMTDEEVLLLAANSALKMAYTANKHTGLRRFIIDLFGDLYAENVLRNVAQNYQPELEEAPDFAFDPDAYSIPPYEYDAYMMDSMIVNEMDDLA